MVGNILVGVMNERDIPTKNASNQERDIFSNHILDLPCHSTLLFTIVYAFKYLYHYHHNHNKGASIRTPT